MMTGNEVSRRLKGLGQRSADSTGSNSPSQSERRARCTDCRFRKDGRRISSMGYRVGISRQASDLDRSEPRDRDLVADMAAATARLFLEHFRRPDFDDESPSDWRQITTLRQLWLPNPSHLDMLHFLNYTYTFTKFGDTDRAMLLNKLGRLMGWLFREAHRPGQITVMVATDGLREAYSFPAEDIDRLTWDFY